MSTQAPAPRVSQSAIAEQAGVARTTVSLALRGGKGLAPETVDRVLTAAKRLGYRPNRLVHGLRSGRTGLIGVMTPPVDSFWSEVLFGIHDGLVEQDFVPMVLWSHHRAEQATPTDELEQVHRLVDWRVDGAVLWPRFAGLFQEHIHEFTDRDLPVVSVDCLLPSHFGAHAVLSDERSGARAVAARLVKAGHRRILHLSGPERESWSQERHHEFAVCLAETPGTDLQVLELPLLGENVALIEPALRDHPRPTAVFAATDNMAEACYRAAASVGLRIPDDLSVVGCGNLEFSGRLHPPLSTVHQGPYEMGRRAAELVAESAGKAFGSVRPVIERLPMEFVDRHSVAPPPFP